MSPDQPVLSFTEAAAPDGRIALDAALLKTLRKARAALHRQALRTAAVSGNRFELALPRCRSAND